MSATAPGQTNPVTAPQSMEIGETANLKPKNAIRRDIPRYIVLAGDHLPEATKRNWKGMFGYQLGGQVFDLTEIPCLWKFSGFVSRGRLTPLIKKPTMAFQAEEIVKKKAEQVAEIVSQTGEAQEVKDVYRMSWPWDSLQSLLSEHNGRKGIVEVPVLEGLEWDLRIAQDIQTLVFPNWSDIEAGRTSMPFKIDDFSSFIDSRKSASADNVFQAVVDAYLESADKFKSYAEEIVRKTKDLARRGASDLGYVMSISPYARHLAAQIGESIENQTVIVNGATGGASRMSADEIALKNRELAIQEEQLRLQRISMGLEQPGNAPVVEMAIPEMPANSQSMEAEPPDVDVEASQPTSDPVEIENSAADQFEDATVEEPPSTKKPAKK